MPMDGCFIHYLVDELNESLSNGKINRIYQPSTYDVILEVRARNKNNNLLLSCNLNTPRVFISTNNFQNPDTPLNFCMVLRKYIERGIINKIHQYQNDRIIILNITTSNDLFDDSSYNLIIEIIGRNSNIILTDNSYTIIDCVRKLAPSLEHIRTILPHAKYVFPENNDLVNPFNISSNEDLLHLQGISKKLNNEFLHKDYNEVLEFLNQKIDPVIFTNQYKSDFYAYPILDSTVIKHFDSLSNLLSEFYLDKEETNNSHTLELQTLINKELKKAINLKDNLENDLEEANKNLLLQDTGILLQANLYKVKKGDKELKVENFLNNNEDFIIQLDPLLEPSINLKKIFNKVKKAKSALIKVNEQLTKINEEIDYLNNLLFQLSISKNDEIDQIKTDLFNAGYIKKKKLNISRKIKINLLTYKIDDCIIYVGKNNLQNDHLTNHVASSNDLWFHVKDAPGSHVIIKVPNNEKDYPFTEEQIRFAANLASYYSKSKTSSSVPVDYTLIRYIKKIPGIKGYHVTYTNQKTIYIDPEEPTI